MKKLLSLLLTLTIFATLIPAAFVQAADSDTIKVAITKDAALMAANKNEDGSSASYGDGKWSNAASALLRSVSTATGALLYQANFDSVVIPDGKAVVKAELNLAIVPSANNGGSSMTIGAYHVTGSYDMSAVTMKSFVGDDSPLSPKLQFPDSATSVYGYTAAEPDAKTVVNCSSFPTGTNCTPFKVDITNIFKKQYPTGSIGDNKDLSIALFCRETGSWGLRYEVAFSEHEIEAARPYITLTLADIPALSVTEKALPETASDDFSLTFTNDIASAKVKVNGAEVIADDVTIDEKALSFEYEYAPYSTYNTEVEVTDVYGQTFSKRYNYTTSTGVESDSKKVDSFYLYTISGGVTNITKTQWLYYNPNKLDDVSNSGMVAKVALPEAESGYVDNFTLNFTNNYSTLSLAYYRVYEYIPAQDVELSALKYDDIKDILASGTSVGTVELVETVSSDTHKLKVDATDYVNKCIKAGKTNVYFIISSHNATHKVAGSSAYYPTVDYTVSGAALLAVADKDISVAGTALKNAEITLATKVSESFLDSVALVDESGNAVTDAKFGLGTEAGTIALDSEVSLEAGRTYSIVIKAGATDELGNTLASDLTVQTFTASGNFTSSDAKILDDTFDTENGDFAQAEAKTSVSAGDSVMAVVDVNNNEASAKGIIIIIASYDADGKLSEVSIKPVSATNGVYASNAITIASTDKLVKAFAWDAATKMPVSAQTIIEVK